MTEQPLVSIIIPTYNRAHLIGETLDSVLAQTYTNWECIVVDDGSTDGTDALMKSYCEKDARFQYHHRPTDRLSGGNAARNYGFEVSKGEYVNWFDSDDVMYKNKLETKVGLLLKSNFDFVVSKGTLYEEFSKDKLIPWPLHTDGNVLFNHICGKIAFVTNGPMFKKGYLLHNVPLFDERLPIRQEWEFFNRLLMKKPSVGIISNPLYLFRKLESGIRGSFSYAKVIGKMKAERLTLKNLKGKSLMNSKEDFIYRKTIIRRCINFYKSLSYKDRPRGIIYGLRTICLAINMNLINNYFLSIYDKIKH